MDFFAHALWTNAAYQKTSRSERLWAVLFGIWPDVVFLPFIFERLFSNTFHFRTTPPAYVSVGYSYTHSLVIFLVAVGLVALWRTWYSKRPAVWWPMFGWGLHIIIDIFTHTDAFFPTPFLFPLSSFHVSIMSWADPTFMLVNYSLLVIAYVEMGRRRRRSRRVVDSQ